MSVPAAFRTKFGLVTCDVLVNLPRLPRLPKYHVFFDTLPYACRPPCLFVARTTADPHRRLNVSIPGSLYDRLNPGRQTLSSRVTELLDMGLTGSPGQKAAPRPKPMKSSKVRTKRSPRPAARPAGIGWGPGSGLGPGKAINLNEYKDGVYIGKSKK